MQRTSEQSQARMGRKIFSLIFFILVIALALGKMSAKPGLTDIVVHQPTTEIQSGFDGTLNVKKQGFEVMNHPSGVYAYTKSWNDSRERGVVKFLHGKNSFEVDNVTILRGLGDSNFPENGVDNWSLSLRLGPEETDSYEAARKKIMSLLAQLRAAGWKRYIAGYDPRLSGKESVVYALSSSGQTYSLDSTYTPTLSEWEQLLAVLPTWKFYSDGIFVDLTVSHFESNTPDMGRYLVDIKISTAADNYSAYFSRDDDDTKRNWKRYLSDRLTSARNERRAVETKLDPHAFTIDTSYEPPPFEAPDFSAKVRADANH